MVVVHGSIHIIFRFLNLVQSFWLQTFTKDNESAQYYIKRYNRKTQNVYTAIQCNPMGQASTSK